MNQNIFAACDIDSLERLVYSEINTFKKTIILLDHRDDVLVKDFEKLTELATKTLQEAKKNKDIRAEADSYYLLAEPHYLGFNYKGALNYYKKALVLYEKLNLKREIANTHKNIGLCHYFLSNNEASFESYFISLNINKELKRFDQTSLLTYNIGLLFDRWKKYDVALDYYNKAYEKLIELNDSLRIAEVLQNIGGIYLSLEDYDKAMEIYNKSLELHTLLNNKYGIALSYSHIGTIHHALLQFDEALSYYDKTLLIYEEINYERGIIILLLNIGDMYHNIAYYNNDSSSINYSIALGYYFEAIKRAKDTDKLKEAVNVFNSIHNTYKMLGEYKKSLEYFKKYIAVKDSIFNEKKYIQTLELEEKMQRENRTIEKDFEAKIEAMEKRNRLRLRILLGSNIFTLLFLLAVVYLYFHLRGKAKAS